MPIIHDVAAFFRWLKEANESELERRAVLLSQFLDKLQFADETRSEANYYLKEIRREQLGRIVRPQ